MATNTLLYAVLIGVATTAAMKVMPSDDPIPSDDQFRKKCKDVYEYFATCDDQVGATETFKMNRGKYVPLV
ncbi:hypothetical protein MTO96_023707, partial [Rhipicephalus appendiculatus]